MNSSLRNFAAELLCHALATPDRLGDLLWWVGFCTVADREHSPTVSAASLEKEVSRREEEARERGLMVPERSLPEFFQLVHAGAAAPSEQWPEVQRNPGAFSIHWNSAPIPPVHSLRLLSEVYWDILLEIKPRKKIVPTDLEKLLTIGAGLFNHGLFFEFHELLEEPWSRAQGPEKQFLQGLIQIAVGFYRLQARKVRGCLQLLREGEGKAAPFAPACLGLEVQEFLAGIAACRGAVARLGERAPDEFDWASIPLMRPVSASPAMVPRDR